MHYKPFIKQLFLVKLQWTSIIFGYKLYKVATDIVELYNCLINVWEAFHCLLKVK